MEPCSNYLGMLDNKYILVKELYSNDTSQTYKVFDSFTEKEFIAKIFNTDINSDNTEIEINKTISRNGSPLFLKYINFFSGPFILDEIEEYNRHYILFEYANKGNLMEYLNIKNSGFIEKIAKIIFFKILKTIQVLQELGICLKNIKLENILLDGNDFDLKLSNFEYASIFLNKKGEKILLQEKVMTFSNAAPEVNKGMKYCGEKAHVFNLGLLLFSLISGSHGFNATKTQSSSTDRNEQLYKLIKENKLQTFWKLIEARTGKKFSPELKKLLIKMLAINPKERPTLEEIYKDEWMKEIISLSENELKNYEQVYINEMKNRNEMLCNMK